jgi:hypothetical protein
LKIAHDDKESDEEYDSEEEYIDKDNADEDKTAAQLFSDTVHNGDLNIIED